MTDKQKNLVTRAITGVLFVGVMVAGFMAPHYMIVLFAVITGMTLWEYTGLVSQIEGVNVNRFISVVAGVYFFIAMAGLRLGYVKDFSVFVPYILTIIYLIIAELYLKNENPINNWAYTMLGQMYIAFLTNKCISVSARCEWQHNGRYAFAIKYICILMDKRHWCLLHWLSLWKA